MRTSLETAIKEMEKAQAALEAAKNSPDKLRPPLTAEQAAYQALLKATPREFRIQRSAQRPANGGQNSGQPNQRQLDQLDMKDEANRYETERQASAAPTQQQREQTETANRLKELAQRQQDLNERLRDLQTALQAAKTDQEREDIQQQLKRLRDEERQMLADVDELRQQLEQSPNASSRLRRGSNWTRPARTCSAPRRRWSAIRRRRRSPPARARSNRCKICGKICANKLPASSPIRCGRCATEARDLAKQEDDIAQKLDSLNNGEHKSWIIPRSTKQLSEQLAKQQSALTNLLARMRAVSEQAENTEPLLSQKFYDTLRRADQRHTDNLLDMGSQLAQRGFLPQTSEVERAARTNINELRQGVESAAESVLGNETDALRYAQKELDDLTRQVEREIGRGEQTARNGRGANRRARTNRIA